MEEKTSSAGKETRAGRSAPVISAARPGIEKLQDRLGISCNAACAPSQTHVGVDFAGKAHVLGPTVLEDDASWVREPGSWRWSHPCIDQ